MDKKTLEVFSDTITKTNAVISASKEMIESNIKYRQNIDKILAQILDEIKNIKDSIYLQERYHRGH